MDWPKAMSGFAPMARASRWAKLLGQGEELENAVDQPGERLDHCRIDRRLDRRSRRHQTARRLRLVAESRRRLGRGCDRRPCFFAVQDLARARQRLRLA